MRPRRPSTEPSPPWKICVPRPQPVRALLARRIVLANGDGDALEVFELLHDGVDLSKALLPTSTITTPSAANRAVQQRRLVRVDTHSPDR